MSNFGHEPAHLSLKQNISLLVAQVYGVTKRILDVVTFNKHNS